VSTALQILSGQGEVLNLDPRQFYIQLYRSILELGSNGPTGVETALGCLEKAFKKRHQVSIQRVAAFVKRLSIVNLQLLPAASLAVMATIRTLMHGYPRCEMLLDVDTPTALYQPEVHDPDVCHADATNLWELTLVGNHYHPSVAMYGRHLIKGAPSQGSGSLPSHMATKSIPDVLKAYSFSEEDPFISVPLPPPHPAEKAGKKRQSYRYRDVPLQQTSLFSVVMDIS
jgi:nucleolar complex protein 3